MTSTSTAPPIHPAHTRIGLLARRLLGVAAILVVAGFAGFWILTSPTTWSLTHPTRDVADAGAPNVANGHTLFYAGSCGTCHATPNQADETKLGGGVALVSGFGTFYMPNISSDKTDGIGGWTPAAFTDAMRAGVSNHGANEYPAFPYTSFQRMTANDLRDLFGYIQTLPPVAGKMRDHDLHFPFNIRRGIGVWKLAFLNGQPLPPAPGKSAAWLRGRYLVEGAAHCAECHSPRDPAGAVISDKRFSGAPDPEGNGYVPNITPDDTGIGYWSAHEIASYLGTGISPIGLTAGGSMTVIVGNMAHRTAEDREAMGEYIKTLPAIDAPNQGLPPPNRTPVIQMLPPSAHAAPSPSSALAVSAATVSQSTTLYAVGTGPLFLAKPAGAPGLGDGKLLPAAKVDVVSQDCDWLQVRISGWQQAGAEASLYALQGQRIMVATLDPAAVAKIARDKTVRDSSTGLTWYEGSITAWVPKTGLNPSLPAVWAYTAGLYTTSCGTCHALHPADSYLATQWIGNLKAMNRFTSLDDGQYRLLLAYLQLHSKDAGTIEAAALVSPAAKATAPRPGPDDEIMRPQLTYPEFPIDSDWDATLAEWLAGLFYLPLTSDAIASYRSGLGAELLDELEQRPGCEDGIMRMRAALTGTESIGELAWQFATAFATLFEGVGGPRTVSPFESAHISPGGRLFQEPAADMERLLQDAGLATTRGIGEPADHLSIELALLAHLLRDTPHQSGAAALLDRHLLTWVPGFVEQLCAADRTGFYVGVGLLLGGFLMVERSMIGTAGEAWVPVPTRLGQLERRRA